MGTIILDSNPVSTSLFITRFDVNSRADLAAVTTVRLPLATVFQFIAGDGPASVSVIAELQSGPADIDDVSQVAVDDYDAVINDKHWQVTGGYLAL